MAAMGRRRKHDLGLEPRVYASHGSFFYAHRGGPWENLGKDRDVANAKARVLNDASGLYGTMVYWLDLFLLDCERRVKLQSAVKGVKLAQRTYEDYRDAIGSAEKPGALRVFFAPPLTPLDVTPDMVQAFLRACAEAGRAVRGNRERAALSACFGWLLREGKVPGLQVNPCLRGSGVQRNPETKRERYVADDEYRDVWAEANRGVRLLMALTLTTLQRPESDIILWDRREVVKNRTTGRTLEFVQHKTGARLAIAFSAELDELIPVDTVVRLPGAGGDADPIVRRLDGGFYTYDGLSAMLKRAIQQANLKRAKRGESAIPSFGFRDLKGKGATDMARRGVPVEQIQALLGHRNKATTEIYIKQRWTEVVQPNQVRSA